MISNVFSLFDDLTEAFKTTENAYKDSANELNYKIKDLQKEVFSLKKQNSEYFMYEKLNQIKIQKEVDEMFPNIDEDIKRFKEDILLMKKLRHGDLPERLEQIYFDLSQDIQIPKATKIDLEDVNLNEFIELMRNKYKLIINTTVKSVKSNLIKPVPSDTKETQTEYEFINSGVYEDLIKQNEKINLLYQSALMQLENHKEGNNAKSQILDKLESEKLLIKNDQLQIKRENELLHKEIINLKIEIENKKAEIVMISNQNNEKIEKILFLEGKVEQLSEKLFDIEFELERAKKSRPPSVKPEKKPRKIIIQQEEESKKSKLDQVTKSGLTVREELEQIYGNALSSNRPRSRILKNEENMTESDGKISENIVENGKNNFSTNKNHPEGSKFDTNEESFSLEKISYKIPDDYSDNSSQASRKYGKTRKKRKNYKNNQVSEGLNEVSNKNHQNSEFTKENSSKKSPTEALSKKKTLTKHLTTKNPLRKTKEFTKLSKKPGESINFTHESTIKEDLLKNKNIDKDKKIQKTENFDFINKNPEKKGSKAEMRIIMQNLSQPESLNFILNENDKICGNDFISETSIGVQVDMTKI